MAACGRTRVADREVACKQNRSCLCRFEVRFGEPPKPGRRGDRSPDSISHKQNAGCRFLRFVIRHSSRCAAKTELCVTVISFEALVSFDSKVFTACPRTIN